MITEQQLVAEIRRVAAEQPDLVYRDGSDDRHLTCRYLPSAVNRQTGCIVGTALGRLGVPEQVLRRMDGDDFDFDPDAAPSGWGDDALESLLDGLVEPQALDSEWLITVQAEQDKGHSWGESVRRADEGQVSDDH